MATAQTRRSRAPLDTGIEWNRRNLAYMDRRPISVSTELVTVVYSSDLPQDFPHTHELYKPSSRNSEWTPASSFSTTAKILLIKALLYLPVLFVSVLAATATRRWIRQAPLHEIPGPARTSLISGEFPSSLSIDLVHIGTYIHRQSQTNSRHELWLVIS